MNAEILQIHNLRHAFPVPGQGQMRDALLIPELHVYTGELLAVTGPSGSGKSTLLNLIAGFFPSIQGEIRKNGERITAPGPDRIVVFQDHAVFPWNTALENAAYGLRGQGIPSQEALARAMDALRLVGLADVADVYPAALSGGMRQRVALARALALNPDILLLDEPFASVDIAGRSHLREVLLRLWKHCNWTVILVTHDLAEAISLADRIMLLLPPPRGMERIFTIDSPRPRDMDHPAQVRLRQELTEAMHRGADAKYIHNP